jgi:hypothetical protein
MAWAAPAQQWQVKSRVGLATRALAHASPDGRRAEGESQGRAVNGRPPRERRRNKQRLRATPTFRFQRGSAAAFVAGVGPSKTSPAEPWDHDRLEGFHCYIT